MNYYKVSAYGTTAVRFRKNEKTLLSFGMLTAWFSFGNISLLQYPYCSTRITLQRCQTILQRTEQLDYNPTERLHYHDTEPLHYNHTNYAKRRDQEIIG